MLARLICASTVGYIYSPSEFVALLPIVRAGRRAPCPANTLHCPDFGFEGEEPRQTGQESEPDGNLGLAA